MPRTRSTLPRPLVLVAAVTLLSAVACSPTAERAPAPATTRSPVAVPLAVDPALDPRTGGGDHTRDWNLAPRSGDLDALAAAVVTPPGGPARVGLWRWAVEEGLPAVDPGPEVPGSVRDVALASVDGRVVVAGTTVVDRRATAFVRVSHDTSTWTALPVDPPSARLTEATSSGDVAHVAGTTAADAVVWAPVTDEAVVLTEVVPAAEGVRRSVVDVAASGAPEDGDLVAILYRETRTDGVQRPFVVARSADGTWTAPAVVDERPGVEVNGVRARLTGGWTATGGVPSGPATGGASRPGAWRTVDGAVWEVIDDEFLGDSEWLSGEQRGWVLGKPSETGNVVPMWELGGRTVVTVMGLDDVESAWFPQFESDPAPVPGVTGVLEYAAGGTPLVLVNGSGWASLGGWAPPGYTEHPGSWWPVADVSPVAPPTSVRVLADGDDGARGQVGTQTLTEVDRGWRTTWASTALRVDGDRVAAAEPPVPDVATGSWSEAVSPQGERLVVQQRSDGDFTSALGTTVVGPDRDGRAQGVLGAGGAHASDVVHTGDRWVVAGADAESHLSTGVSRPAVWTSSDGNAWVHVGLDVGDARQGEAEAVCQDGDLAAGWVRRHDGTTRPVLWRVTGDTAVELDHGVDDATPTWFDACRTADGTTLVHGWVAGVAALWRVAGDGTLEPVLRPPVGATFEAPVPVAGGWAAWGTVDDADGTGPVLWWSTDGRGWSTIAVPTDVPLDAGVAVADGRDVVALAWGAAGMRAWRVTGLTGVAAPSVAAGG